MADTARQGDETVEYIDDSETRSQKIDELIELIRASNHFIVFTGAGLDLNIFSIESYVF